MKRNKQSATHDLLSRSEKQHQRKAASNKSRQTHPLIYDTSGRNRHLS